MNIDQIDRSEKLHRTAARQSPPTSLLRPISFRRRHREHHGRGRVLISSKYRKIAKLFRNFQIEIVNPVMHCVSQYTAPKGMHSIRRPGQNHSPFFRWVGGIRRDQVTGVRRAQSATVSVRFVTIRAQSIRYGRVRRHSRD